MLCVFASLVCVCIVNKLKWLVLWFVTCLVGCRWLAGRMDGWLEHTELVLPSLDVRALNGRMPKSSCVVLLRQLPAPTAAGIGRGAGSAADDASESFSLDSTMPDLPLVLACTVHLSSAPSSDTRKVKHRRGEMRATLHELSQAVALIKSQDRCCVVVLSGDFNAIREEFVLGNGEECVVCCCSAACVIATGFIPPQPWTAGGEVAGSLSCALAG